MQDVSPVFYVVLLLMSVVVHEVAHGYAALSYGDQTAKYEGRLTLNPLKHLDLYGSIVLPLLLILANAPFLIGWAKPVPYNPNNFRPEERRVASIWVAAAGILTNLALAIFFGVMIRLSATLGLPDTFVSLSAVIVQLNIVLAFFNLIPIPPLDGSKILFGIIGYKSLRLERFMEQYSIMFLLIFVFFLWRFLAPVLDGVFGLVTGLS